jgi:hypothetical protein
MKRITLASLLALSLGALVLLPAPAASAAVVSIPKAINGTKITQTVHTAIGKLRIANENRYGYERSKSKHWIDVDRDCQDARAEVLKSESKTPVNSGCTIKWGTWYSSYDGLTITSPSSIDIDHMVPLAEAWDSGARAWSAAKRSAYANDLTDPRPLIAVSASSNRSKGDKDPAEWLPSRNVCGYIRQWVVVKTRWSLAVDKEERAFLLQASSNCPSMTFTTHKAVTVLVTYGSPTCGGSGGDSGGSLDPRFSTCTAAKAAGYGPYVRGSDPEYYWYEDRDNDGIVCE